ncbi:universal stress protein [Motiliproteus sp.]|uniref:universal stress protein n=1 Tax=Motiliproteus sp. TaxID=1898955 RepID=UPI003BAAABA4
MNGFSNILYFADAELGSTPALERAIALAERHNARLTLMDVVDRLAPIASLKQQLNHDINEIVQQFQVQALNKLVSGIEPLRYPVQVKVNSGWGFIEVIREVMSGTYDLLIKSAHNGCERRLSSGDMHLLRKCPCPVWIDRSSTTTAYRSILAAVDPTSEHHDDCADRVLELAAMVANNDGAQLGLVHAWQLAGESMLRDGLLEFENAQLESLLEQQRSSQAQAVESLLKQHQLSSGDVEVHLQKGPASQVINQVREQVGADLVVMGTVGRTGLPGFIIGNTAEDVLQQSCCSVLAVKPSGFVSPVEPR